MIITLLFEVNVKKICNNRARCSHSCDGCTLKNQVESVWIITYNQVLKKKNLLEERRTVKSSLRLNSTLTSIKFQLDDNRVSMRNVCCKSSNINAIYSKVRLFHTHQKQLYYKMQLRITANDVFLCKIHLFSRCALHNFFSTSFFFAYSLERKYKWK